MFSFRNCLFFYIAFFLALTFPYWLQGEVIAPYRQTAELAAPEASGAGHLENRKFSDYSNGYIPEITGLMHGQRSGWLALWTGRNELGRPLEQISGFSPAYPPSLLIAAFSNSPQRFITVLSLGICFLAGLFALMLCKELRLSPLAGLLASGSLAASPFFMYWLTFPMFPAVWCWSAGAMYAVTRLARKPDLLGWSVLSFSIDSLLMTAYPQPVVFHAYILTGYGAYLAYGHWQSKGGRSTARYLAVVTSAVVVGGLLALPTYADLAYTASESARVAPDPSFFMANFPQLDSLNAVVRFVVLGTFPEILGNPISPSYPFVYDGRSVTPLVIFLSFVSLLRFRENWGWWLAVVVLCALMFVHPFYVFGVKHLGFNLSRTNPIGMIMLPVTIIAAYGADALIRRTQMKQYSRAAMMAAGGTLLALTLAVAFGLALELFIRWGAVAMSLLVTGLLAAQFDRTRPALLVAALLAVASSISFPLMLRQDASLIVTSSPLVEKLRSNLPPDSRYAVAAPGLGVLPPNLNAAVGLASLHSYNSLSSRRYHTLIKALGGEVLTYGRWNGSISPDYGSAMFWMSNVALMLSASKLEHDNLDYLGKVGDVHLHRVISRMGCCLQVTLPPNSMTPDGITLADPRSLALHRPAKTLDKGDLLEFDVQGSQSSLLILSQKFHRDWQAQVLTGSVWTEAKTVPVNEVFQGVLLPEGAQKLRLQFKPYVRFAWLAHVFWLLVLMALAYQALQSRKERRSDER